MTTTPYVRTQPSSQRYLLRLQGLLRPIRTENAEPVAEADIALDTAENGRMAVATQGQADSERVEVLVEHSSHQQ